MLSLAHCRRQKHLVSITNLDPNRQQSPQFAGVQGLNLDYTIILEMIGNFAAVILFLANFVVVFLLGEKKHNRAKHHNNM